MTSRELSPPPRRARSPECSSSGIRAGPKRKLDRRLPPSLRPGRPIARSPDRRGSRFAYVRKGGRRGHSELWLAETAYAAARFVTKALVFPEEPSPKTERQRRRKTRAASPGRSAVLSRDLRAISGRATLARDRRNRTRRPAPARVRREEFATFSRMESASRSSGTMTHASRSGSAADASNPRRERNRSHGKLDWVRGELAGRDGAVRGYPDSRRAYVRLDASDRPTAHGLLARAARSLAA